MFDIDTTVDGTTLTLRLVGELTNDVAYLPWEITANLLADQTTDRSPGRSRAAEATGINLVVLDLFAVTFTDTTGLTALVRVRELADAHGAGCRLRGVQPRTRQLLEMTGLLDTFDISPDL